MANSKLLKYDTGLKVKIINKCQDNFTENSILFDKINTLLSAMFA
jgi:hypothetical protein